MLAAYMADSKLDPATPRGLQRWRVLLPDCGSAKSPRFGRLAAQRDASDALADEARIDTRPTGATASNI